MIWFEPPSQMIGWGYTAPTVLDDTMIDFVTSYADEHDSLFQSGEIWDKGNEPGNSIEKGYRRSNIMFLTDMDYFRNLYNHIIETVLNVNNTHFKYALNYLEPLQYSVYESANLGYYDIHTDSYLRNTSGFIRKVSFSILLDDPADFEGGDFLVHATQEPVKIEIQKGDIFLFPSFVPHSVTPVTKGVRRALVGWVCGPNFV